MGLFEQLFKTPEQKQQDLKNYYAWAYPYGDEHKSKIEELVHSFVSEDDPKFAMYNYLVCRQALAPSTYEGKYVVPEDQFKPAAKKLKREFVSKGKKTAHKYMALVEADLQIDESLNYPSLEQLENRANEIQAIINKK